MNTETRNTTVAIAEEAMESVAQKLFHDVVIKAVIREMVIAIPFLGHPILNPVVIYIVTKIAMKVYKQAKLVGGMYVIKLKNDSERRAYDEAIVELKKALNSGNNIEEAKNEFKKRLSDLVRIDVRLVRQG